MVAQMATCAPSNEYARKPVSTRHPMQHKGEERVDYLKLTVQEWHLLTIAYQIFVDESPQEPEEMVHRRMELAERIASFTAQVNASGQSVVVQIERKNTDNA